MMFKVGQRWVSQAEPQLGLGIIAHVAGRRVSISFPAADEERTYAADSAPLSRVQFKAGDVVETVDGVEVTLSAVVEQKGLMLYAGIDGDGEELVFAELELSCHIQLHTPQQRLSGGQTDKLSAYKLRVQTLLHRQRLQQSPVRGLMGSRTSLLPHQVYIAHEVAKRYAPRVLLADEVGLGKTIEAGMILHHQLYTGLASRVLIVVPDSLVNQWLIEMLRRFNLHFSLFDVERFVSLREEGIRNPFDTEQLIICGISLITRNPEYRDQAAAVDWDLMIVDEAHHLHWSATDPSPEYRDIEMIARHSKGLLLLTATPEQVGIESHFARLRLLDPARFHDLEEFRKEEANYESLMPLVKSLQALESDEEQDSPAELPDALKDALGQWLDSSNLASQTPEQIIYDLLDRHGTGRVLFRNTRAAVQGFPERRLNPWPLVCPEIYTQRYGEAAIQPEYQAEATTWLKEDPRVAWLEQQLNSLKPKKVLVICAQAQTAVALEEYLELRCGIRGAVFHEGMSLLERDRAAAYFAETEQGAQVLICSEIGSEGRNFQFAHHLVLFDLPLNPDLLEQRIGRLDRIGQRFPIEIHTPYLQGTTQEVLFRWYDEGLGLFRQSFSAGFAAFEAFETELRQQLNAPDEDLPALLERATDYVNQTRACAAQGRDPLLELNSCRGDVANHLIEEIEEAEDSTVLKDYMEDMCDHYGVHYEEHSLHALILQPTDQMLTGHFPGLKDEDGITVTFNREQGLRREDMQFLSWEHPIVEEAMDMLLSGELGNATLVTLALKGVTPGTLLLEAYYAVNVVAPRECQLEQFLPATPVRVLVDMTGKSLGHALTHEQLNSLCNPVKIMTVPQIIKQIGGEIDTLLQHAETLASAQLDPLKQEARARMATLISQETQRLRALQKVNPSVREEEIIWFEDLSAINQELIDRAALELQAVRLIIAT
ncbi:MAG: RNA polymerase-associated protein RapA [Hahellaceae bacterium]|nr:RNA polymerase-associated protein RapA [Hahellaceae bacterium]